VPVKDPIKRKEIQKRYVERHKDEINLRARTKYARPEVRARRIEYGKKYRKKHQKQIQEYASRNDVIEKARKRAKEWRKNNREYAAQRDRQYYESHKVERRNSRSNSQKKWRINNPEKYAVRLKLTKTKPFRIGQCSICGKSDSRTEIHHIKYHLDNPLKDTVELCISCHKNEHVKLRNGGDV
jgi:hypothetical protein